MREEDKVLLLAEIMGVDTSQYVEKYLDELRGSQIFMRLCNDVREARNSNSYKSQFLIDEFEAIDFSKIFKANKTKQIKIIITFVSAAVAFSISFGFGHILELIINL